MNNATAQLNNDSNESQNIAIKTATTASDQLSSNLQELLATPSNIEWALSESVQEHAKVFYQELATLLQSISNDSQNESSNSLAQTAHVVQNYVRSCVPSLVALLEALEVSHTSRCELEVQLELAREDSAALVKQFKREKESRQRTEQRCMEMECAFEVERDEVQRRIDQLEIAARNMEMRMKRSEDISNRCQQREQEAREELEQVQRRFREVLRKQTPPSTSATQRKVTGLPAANDKDVDEPEDQDMTDENAREIPSRTKTNSHSESDWLELLKENEELIATKNALNVDNHNMNAKLEEITCELVQVCDALQRSQEQEARTLARLQQSEEEVKSLREKLQSVQEEAHSSDPQQQARQPWERTVFTREEMARVLTERNQYKERLLDLEDSVRRYHALRCGADEEERQQRYDGDEQNKNATLPSNASTSSWWEVFSLLLGAGNSTEEVQTDMSTLSPHGSQSANVTNPMPTSSASPAPPFHYLRSVGDTLDV